MDMSIFSQLRWNFVYQRPQHLIGRMTKEYRTFYFEEPEDIENYRSNENTPTNYHHYISEEGVNVIVPLVKAGDMDNAPLLEKIVKQVHEDFSIEQDIFWYYTPMAMAYTSFFNPKITIYDCMDQLAAFKNAPQNLISLEKELFKKADLVFTGGRSLYKAKQKNHDFVYCFPSSIDQHHFKRAATNLPDPEDQKGIPHPRAGFYGVVDERFDTDLLKEISSLLPNWSFVVVGPTAKIDPATLPQAENIHYLGIKKYAELPRYLANWDAAIMPFALNESTKYISPTKTPEYLAAGKKVVSTAVHDVVHPYEDLNLVSIARSSAEFADQLRNTLVESPQWEAEVEAYLKDFSWDDTCKQMNKLITEKVAEKDKVLEEETVEKE
ncbi:MAG: glycosyltransferase [Desemzia incerta]